MVLNIEVFMGEPAFLAGKKSVQKVLILLHKPTKWRFLLAEKIKPKWSPCPMKSADEPKYRSIQPILPKPKSPHAIT